MIMGDNEDIKRKNRHKRRVRNQIISYIILLLLICLIGFLGYKGIKLLVSKIKNNAEVPAEVATVVDSSVSEDQVPVISTPEYEDLPDVSSNDAGVSENKVEDTAARAYIDGLTTEQKVASLFIVTPESITGVNTATQAGEGTRQALTENMVGGIVYASKNVSNSPDFKAMVSTTKSMYSELYGCDLWAVVNEEGAVNTIAGYASGVTAQQAASELGSSGDNNNAYTAYVNIATTLSDYGIDVDMAPVCDVSSNPQGFIGNRSFSSDADIASSMVKSAVSGLNDKEVIACLSSFPGQGEANTNPANGVSTIDRSIDDLKTAEYLPFQAGIDEGASMVMMSNIIDAMASDESVPCSMSKKVIESLRTDLGFEGIVVSGPLDDKAITGQFSQGDAAVNAINAGCDMIFRPANYKEAYEGVLAAVNDGTISAERLDEALMRIYSKKFQ